MNVHNIIAGRRVEASAYMEVKSPYDGQVIGKAPKTSAQEVNAAISSLKLPSFPVWKRAELLEAIADEVLENKEALAQILVSEIGKPYKAALHEVGATATRFRYAAAEARLLLEGQYIDGSASPDKEGKQAFVYREPVGKVLAIVPFNYPMAATALKVAPALAAGNAVIVKASSSSALSTLKLMEFVAKHFDGAVSAVNAVDSDAKALLITHSAIDLINFTGSTHVGELVAEKAGMKKFIMELGGKGIAFVLPDADVQLAAKEIAKGALSFSGQRCDAITKVVVHPEIKQELVNALKVEIARYRVGDPSDPMVNIGPLVNGQAVERVHKLVLGAVEKGAKLLMGGQRDGNIYYPTLLVDINEGMDIAKEEIFGPVVTVQEYFTEKDILTIARDSGYGLDSAIFTRDFTYAFRLARQLPDGSVTLNAAPSHGIGFFPFGGNGKSGMGREGVKRSLLEMTKTKTIIF